jgi:hypothetical protein
MLDAQNCVKERKVFTLWHPCVSCDGWRPSVFWSILHKVLLFPANKNNTKCIVLIHKILSEHTVPGA